jgi:hypothetical protein
MACTDQILARISDPQIFSAWKLSINTAIVNSVTPAIRQDVSNTISCVQSKIDETRKISSELPGLYQIYANLQTEYKTKTDAMNISKDRAALLTHPEQKTTVYESWYPIHRPLRTSSFLLLIVTSLFFFSIFLGLLARQLGVFVSLGYMYTPSAPGSMMSMLLSKMNFMTIGLGAAVVVCIGVIIYLLTKKK